jgi:DNA-binding MarR family transcriptional regulator
VSAREPMAKDPIGLARDNWVTHGWEDAADGMHLVTSIMRVQQAYLGQIEAILRPSGLTFARFEVLRLLAFSRLGSLPVGKVGERLQVHPASVTNAVQRLEADGLVFRRTNPSDGRGVLAEITPSGRRLVDKCTHQLNARVFTTMPISRADQRRTSAALTEIRQSFGDFR